MQDPESFHAWRKSVLSLKSIKTPDATLLVPQNQTDNLSTIATARHVPFCKPFTILGDKSVLGIRVSCACEDHSAAHDDRRTKDDALSVTVIGIDQSTRDRSSNQTSKTDDKR